MISLLEELEKEKTASMRDKFYKEFASLGTNEDTKQVISKVWELIDKHVLSKGTIYLSLVVNKNAHLLEKCLTWEGAKFQCLDIKECIKDPNLLYDYTAYTKRHWFDLLISNWWTAVEILPKAISDKLIFLEIIRITNEHELECNRPQLLNELLKSYPKNGIDGFWVYYAQEIENILNLFTYCQNKSQLSINRSKFIHFASQHCTLEILSNFLKLELHYDDVKQLLAEMHEKQLLPNDQSSHFEDFQIQKEILICFSILVEFFQLILPDNFGQKNVNEKIRGIQDYFLMLKDHCLQVELLHVIFASLFLKTGDLETGNVTDGDNHICKEKEVRVILFILKSLIEEVQFSKPYESDLVNLSKLKELHKLVIDATWRLDLIVNVVKPCKLEGGLLPYMLTTPQSLINLCLRNEDFERAHQVLKIFNLQSTPIAKEVIFTEKLHELKELFKKATKARELKDDALVVMPPSAKLQFDEIADDFFRQNHSVQNSESEEVILEHIEQYPYLEHFRSEKETFMNILDLAITEANTYEDSRRLLELALTKTSMNESDSYYKGLLTAFRETGEAKNWPLHLTLLSSDRDLFTENKNKMDIINLYTLLCQSLYVEENPGQFNDDHVSHKHFNTLLKYMNSYSEESVTSREGERVKYLQKLFNYLRAFSKILFIEKDSSQIISKGKNCSYFSLLFHNRSELMGHLLFEENLDPTEFEKYFAKLQLDFLYHVAGNCFPTINVHSQERVSQEELYPDNTLYPPNRAVITYIKQRNWLIALLLIEMHGVEDVGLDIGVSRIQNFINYLRLPRVQMLQPIFKYNEIVTALQNEISFQEVHDFVYTEIGKHILLPFTHSSGITCGCDAAEEISEDKLKSTNWCKLYQVIDSIPEKEFKKHKRFKELRDMLLINLIRDGFECEYYNFALKIEDKEARINVILDHMKIWPVDFCIDCIKSELTRPDVDESDARITELRSWLKHIELSKRVMTATGVANWSELYEMCSFRPKDVLQKLLFNREVELLMDFTKLNDLSSTLLPNIDENVIELAFDAGVHHTSIVNLLSLLPKDQRTDLCKNLLPTLKNVQQLQFLIGYLKEQKVEVENLAEIALSTNILSVLDQCDFDQQLLFLLREPLSIIEVFIMNTKLDKLGAALEIIRSNIVQCGEESGEEQVTVEKIDELLRRYAEKSLDFRVIAQPDPRLLRTPEPKLLQSWDSVDPHAKGFVMPEDVPSREEWVSNTDVIECMCCRCTVFSMFNRRHHCRRCGRVICASCSKKRMVVPNYGDIMVRVCDDCFVQTFNDASEDTLSTKSALDDYWMLTNDAEHNRIVREEFSYEFAPSVSLCLSLMKYHSKSDEYSRFLLDQCDLLLKLLIPNQEYLQEIDYMLVIRMLRSLALAAKMAAQDTSLRTGLYSADRILSQAELVGLLAERGCLNLLPISGNVTFIDSIALMRLTDKLLEREQWNLALEVSTKAGIDKSGVFVAWGISCLKAGNLAAAREKFSKCLDKNILRDPSFSEVDHGASKVIRNPPLLNEIIEILESKKETIDEGFVVDHQKLLGSSMTTLNQSVISSSQTDGAIFILNKLKNLKNIECGYYSTNTKPRSPSDKMKLEPVIYDECVYYLNKYGTAISLAEFHVRYGQFGKAVECIIKKQLSPEAFVDIYMKCLKQGSVTMLQERMAEIDSTLIMWKDYLIKICSHLEKQNMLHSLYQLQLYMGDYVRAATTCVKFYEERATSFTDLFNNNNYLKEAIKHLVQAKEQEQWVAVLPISSTSFGTTTFEESSITSPLVKKMSHADIEKHTATMLMQLHVAHFLAERENNEIYPMQMLLNIFPNPDNIPRHKVSVPTLFGSENQRTYVAVLCLVCADTVEDGFELASKITKDFKQVRPAKVYKEVAKYFAQAGKFRHITDLVTCVQKASMDGSSTASDICDEMLICTVATLRNADVDPGIVDDLIKLISDKSAKISAYIEAKQLKKAYFEATRHKRVVDLKRIMREAELSNDIGIKVLCQKAIQKHS